MKRAAFAAILVLALGLRLGLALSAGQERIGGDPVVYDDVGVSIAAGHGWSRHGTATALHPPAWPALLGAADALTDHEDRIDVAGTSERPPAGSRTLAAAHARWRTGRIVNALLGTLSVALIALIAGELWGARGLLAGAAVAAVYPALAVLGIALLSEPLFVVLELGAVYAVLRSRGAVAWALAAGVLCGLAVLTRANGAVLLVPLALGLRRPRAVAALLAAAVLTVAPWTVRNVDALHAPVPVATDLGQTLAGTYDPLAAADRFRWRNTRRLPASDDAALAQPTEAKRSAALTHDGLDYLRAHPADVLKASFWNTARLLELDRHRLLAGEIGSTRLAEVSALGFAALAALALIGAFTRSARAAPRWLWLVPLLMWLGTVPFAVNFSRFRAPIDPFLELLAAAALAAAAARLPSAAAWRPCSSARRSWRAWTACSPRSAQVARAGWCSWAARPARARPRSCGTSAS